MLFAADDMMIDHLMQPVARYGFAGMTVVLLAFLFVFVWWVVKQLVSVVRANTRVIEANTQTISRVNDTVLQHEERAAKRDEKTRATLHVIETKLATCLARGGP